MKKRAVLTIGCIALLGAACSESLDTSSRGATPAAGSGPAPLVPEVVCVTEDFFVSFAYDNQSDAVVVLDPADNVLSGTAADDEPFVPTHFAPGRSAAVFSAIPEGEPTAVTWELTGPDGVTRSATPTADTPSCADLTSRMSTDTRTPELVTSAEFDEATNQVTLDLELTGVPPASVCNEAFEPSSAIIRFERDNGEVLAEGTTLTMTSEVAGEAGSGRVASFDVSVVVIDRCTYDGTTFSSWPGGAFVDLFYIGGLCVDVEGTAPEVSEGACSGGLPLVPGSKIRSG